MNIAAILREIDTEIKKLTEIRQIVAGLAHSAHRAKKTKTREVQQRALQAQSPELLLFTPEKRTPTFMPQLVVLPPVRRREYQPRTRRVTPEAIALAAAPSERPVFVPRTLATKAVEPVSRSTPMKLDQMEAAFRQNLLGGAA